MCDLPSYSKLLYDITSQDPSNPSEQRVRNWIDQLNDALHCTLKFSKALASTLVQRANNVRYRMKNKGGRRRSKILSPNWTLTTSFDEDNPSTPSSSSEVARLSSHISSKKGGSISTCSTADSVGNSPTSYAYCQTLLAEARKKDKKEASGRVCNCSFMDGEGWIDPS